MQDTADQAARRAFERDREKGLHRKAMKFEDLPRKERDAYRTQAMQRPD